MKKQIEQIEMVFVRYLPNTGRSPEAKEYNRLATSLHCERIREQYIKVGDLKGLELFNAIWACKPYCSATGKIGIMLTEEAEQLVKKKYADYDIFGNRGPDYKLTYFKERE